MSAPEKTDALRVLVIGGSAAGPKAAARTRRLAPHAEITLLQKGAYLSMASCGYPYYVGGTFDDRNQLISTPTGVLRDPQFYMKAKRIDARTRTEAVAIDRETKTVRARRLDDGTEETFAYDKLVLATGAEPVVPPVPGRDLEGISTLQSMEDADYLRRVRDEGKVKKAVVIGGGLIGLETCEALRLAGIEITVIEMQPQLLGFLDWELAKLVENHVRANAANVITGNPLAEFLGTDGRLSAVKLKNGTELPCELAVVAVGVRPNSGLARESGLAVGELGGITVDDYMRTSDPDIYAAGDCCEIPHRLTRRPTLAPYGDLANLQARIAATNLVEAPSARYPGTFQTGICKVFDYAAGSTGLSETAARAQGLDVVSALTAMPDKPGFMGAKPMVLKMTCERKSGRLLGMQAVGEGDVSKRIAAAAMALHGGLSVEDLVHADLPYAPPFSSAIDALITTAHVLENKLAGRMKGLQPREFKEMQDAGEEMFVLDVRGPDEFEAMRLGIGETLIPLGALRDRLDELPDAREARIVVFCKISLRGYEAARLLEGEGYTNVHVLEGGILAWPYPREK